MVKDESRFKALSNRLLHPDFEALVLGKSALEF
jgi:hypothetical protein